MNTQPFRAYAFRIVPRADRSIDTNPKPTPRPGLIMSAAIPPSSCVFIVVDYGHWIIIFGAFTRFLLFLNCTPRKSRPIERPACRDQDLESVTTTVSACARGADRVKTGLSTRTHQPRCRSSTKLVQLHHHNGLLIAKMIHDARN